MSTTKNLLLNPFAFRNLPSGLVGRHQTQLACPTPASVAVVCGIQLSESASAPLSYREHPDYVLSPRELVMNLRGNFKLPLTVAAESLFIFDPCGLHTEFPVVTDKSILIQV